jgi:dolichol-phosphate mannosyltransferase
MNFLARRRGYRIVETPIHFTDRAVGQSKMNFRVKVESAVQPWRLRWRYRGAEKMHMPAGSTSTADPRK